MININIIFLLLFVAETTTNNSTNININSPIAISSSNSNSSQIICECEDEDLQIEKYLLDLEDGKCCPRKIGCRKERDIRKIGEVWKEQICQFCSLRDGIINLNTCQCLNAINSTTCDEPICKMVKHKESPNVCCQEDFDLCMSCSCKGEELIFFPGL